MNSNKFFSDLIHSRKSQNNCNNLSKNNCKVQVRKLERRDSQNVSSPSPAPPFKICFKYFSLIMETKS